MIACVSCGRPRLTRCGRYCKPCGRTRQLENQARWHAAHAKRRHDRVMDLPETVIEARYAAARARLRASGGLTLTTETIYAQRGDWAALWTPDADGEDAMRWTEPRRRQA